MLAWEQGNIEQNSLSHHHVGSSVLGDVEGNEQEDVVAELVQLPRQSAVHHAELEQRVARRTAK